MDSIVVEQSGLADAVQLRVYEFHFAPTEALATNGSIIPLVKAQRSASPFVYLCVGLGDLSTAKLTAAQAKAVVAKAVQAPSIGEVLPLATTLEDVGTGLKAYMDEIEAAADGADCITFCLGGVKFTNVVAVTLQQMTEAGPVAGKVVNVARNVATRLYTQGTSPLGDNGKLLKTASAEVDLDTETLICAPEYNLIAGSFKVAESDNLVLADGQDLVLRVVVKA